MVPRGDLPRRLREGVFRTSARQFLVSLVVLMVAMPFTAHLPMREEINSLLLCVVLVSGVLAVGGRRRMLVVTGGLAVPAVGLRLLHVVSPGLLPDWIGLVFALLLVGTVAAQLFRFILVAPQVDSEVLAAGMANYLLLGVAWSFAYMLAAAVAPGSLAFGTGMVTGEANRNLDILYFSFITLSTVGYGDITPVTGPARMLAVTEAIAGTFYVAILISRLVAMHTSRRMGP